ncbi:hypothetical protein OPT61_g3317 [Boeremia exigua]|uniref:Uncharacterized protein n=1 Tax=Boeremia exigua TaxID=749465 RepID=A0ACC2IIF4_9PLEO|nr:hypothetical protein OPT61_g3317 [Boeremia exigua]
MRTVHDAVQALGRSSLSSCVASSPRDVGSVAALVAVSWRPISTDKSDRRGALVLILLVEASSRRAYWVMGRREERNSDKDLDKSVDRLALRGNACELRNGDGSQQGHRLCTVGSRRSTTPPPAALLSTPDGSLKIPNPLLQHLVLPLDLLELRPLQRQLLIPWRADDTAAPTHLHAARLAADALPMTLWDAVSAQWQAATS